jgi:hypothetical protein
MPTIRTKNDVRIVDPGGDAAVSKGGFIEVAGVVESTQVSGWRQRLVTRGAAVTTT